MPNVVHPGTVASRIKLLEAHPPPHSELRRPSLGYVDRDSRLGFGHRLASRFGKPASRNERPSEEAQVISIHSYIGLNTQRTQHLQEHGVTDGGSDTRRTTYSRASGINYQLQPQGLAERTQYDVLSPWYSTSSFWSTPLEKNQRDKDRNMDHLAGVDGSGSKSLFPGHDALFRKSSVSMANSHIPRASNTRHENTAQSDASVITTSTVRRQSVRDIFADHGIERPPGLVSETPRFELSKPAETKTRCMNCSWYNLTSANWCSKCKYFIRSLRNQESYPSLVSPRGEQYYLEKVSDELPTLSEDSSEKENLPSRPTVSRNVSSKKAAEAFETRKQAIRQSRNLSGVTSKFPSFNMAQSPPKSTVPSLRKVTAPETSTSPETSRGSRTKSIVKDSPFLIADRLLSRKLGSSCPTAPRMDGSKVCRTTRSKLHLHQEANAECESVACRATHEDPEPYRHSVSCTSNKKRSPEITDVGYMADTRLIDETDQFHASRQYGSSKEPTDNSSRLGAIEAPQKNLGPEYVKCYGYPRTGHARHGSATSAAEGQCQHCIDDCPCPACQETHHSVRCCVNEDHSGTIHHHHAPKDNSTPTRPLDCPTFKTPPGGQVFKPESKLHLSEAQASKSVNSPPPSINRSPLRTTSKVSQAKLMLEAISRKATETPEPLPNSKRSTLIKETPKTGTSPPPWMFPPWGMPARGLDPKVRDKTPSTTAVSELRVGRTAIADTTLDVRGISDPPPPFKERPTLPPPATCDETSPERSPSRPESESRALSNTYSDLFRSGEKSVVPSLNQKLLAHQEELKNIEKECDDRLSALSGGSENSDNEAPPTAAAKGKQKVEKEEERRFSSSEIKASKKVERPTPPCCPDDAPVPEHTLSDDETTEEKDTSLGAIPEHSLSEDCTINEEARENCPQSSADPFATVFRPEQHECVWKDRYLASKDDNKIRSQGKPNLPLKGITLVVRMEGREDVVIETDLLKVRETKASL